MKSSTRRVIFYIIFFVLLFLPAIAMLISWIPRDIIVNVSVLLGFLGLALAGLQLIPIAKLNWLADALDMDKVYSTHHLISILAIVLVLLHPIILLITSKVFRAGFALNSGWIGLAGLILIGLTSGLRKRLNLGYVPWLGLHNLLTAIILVFGLWHMFRVNYYMEIPLVRWVWIVEIIAMALIILYIRVIHPFMVGRKPFKVESVEAEPNGVYSLNLLPDGHAGVPFKAGQIAWISTGKSPWVLSRNPFSYAGSDVAPGGRVRFAIKELGDFTSTIKNLKPGDRVYVDGPYGYFHLHMEDMMEGFVLLAGGIGVAPVMSIMNTLADTNDKRPVYVFYGDYNEDTALYQDEFAAAAEKINLKYFTVLEKPLHEGYPYPGYITSDLMTSVLPENYKDLFYFVCGPAPMLRAMERNFVKLGIASNHVHFGIQSSQVHIENFEMA
ncbi:MAG: ferredoxin reductase family protein [Anaerolineaceae bacterium]|nr:ferredoxin reductase family protein [Anaerolineaceae bacterium]